MRRLRMMTAPSWSLFTDSGTNSETKSSRVTADVERDALRHHELVEVGVLLEGDERAHAVARELGRRGHHLVDDPRLLRARESAEKGAAAHAHEPAADVVLEDDHHDEDDRREQRREQVEERDQPDPLAAR